MTPPPASKSALALLVALFAAGACGQAPAASPRTVETTLPAAAVSPTTSVSTSMPAAATVAPESPAPATATPEPTSPPPPVDDVPPRLTGPDLVTRYCDVFDGVEGAEPPLYCTDTVAAVLRATRERLPDVATARFRYAACDGVACPDAATVVLGGPSGTLTVDVTRTETDEVHLSGFAPGPAPAPPPEPFTSPPIDRPDLPLEMADRKALPFCGRIGGMAEVEPVPSGEHAGDDDPQRCFLRSIETGQPAELIEDGWSLEGAATVRVYRFMGAGAVVWSSREEPNIHSNGEWFHRTCGIYLDVEPRGFYCD